MEPVGHDYEAVITFKQYCDKSEIFYACKVNDNRGNPDKPSFVFKMGAEKARMVINMDRDGEHYLRDEFCFFDGKRKRCRGFVTLTASVYHPLLREQVPLTIMEATPNITLFWTLFIAGDGDGGGGGGRRRRRWYCHYYYYHHLKVLEVPQRSQDIYKWLSKDPC